MKIKIKDGNEKEVLKSEAFIICSKEKGEETLKVRVCAEDKDQFISLLEGLLNSVVEILTTTSNV